jgi:hypothetical protein
VADRAVLVADDTSRLLSVADAVEALRPGVL